MKERVVVVGGGVVGLTCAAALSENYDVMVVGAELSIDSPSKVATAIWHIYLVDPNDQATLRWSEVTLKKLIELEGTTPACGVKLVTGIELFRNSEPALPTWHAIPPLFEMLSPVELAQYSGVRWGYRISAPVADIQIYLKWLHSHVVERGVTLLQRKFDSLDDAFEYGNVLVNCTGFGARELLNDELLVPVRGQYLVVQADSAAPTTYLGDDHHPNGTAYVIPRAGEICIGGTEEYGEYKTEFTETIESLCGRAGEFLPWIRTIQSHQIVRKVVGLRPYRKTGVRFELEQRSPNRYILHNYGHGGSGFSLSWGCAEQTLEVLLTTFRNKI